MAAAEWTAPDFGAADYVRAVVNILEDFSEEKARLQTTQKAILNVLEDFGVEKRRLESTQSAVLNILDDLGVEKARLEQTQREVMESEQAIRASLQEKEILLREIHHRVKNNLQVTSSLLKLQSAYVHDPRALEMFAESQNRIRSMALVHEKLYQSSELSRIDVADYAESLAKLLFRSFGARGDDIALTVEAEGVFLSIEAAVPCGLILNELISNCLKHAFPDGRTGEIGVRVVAGPGGDTTLSVRDNGVGLPPALDVDHTETLGLQLVRTLVDQLHGALEVVRGERTEFRIRFEEMP